MAAELPFDQVEIEGETVSVDDFLALPLFKRVRYVLAGGLRFLQSGAPVDQREALRALRERAT
jgi:hypothetical protein